MSSFYGNSGGDDKKSPSINIDNTLTKVGQAADAYAAGHIIVVSDTEPENDSNKIWVKDESADEILVPTMDEFNEFKNKYSSPLTASTVSAMMDNTRIYVYTGSETGYVNGNWYYYDGDNWVSGGVYNSVAVDTDDTLSIADKAADAKAVGDEMTALRDDFEQLVPGLSDEAKAALLACFEHVAWVDDDGQDYYDALEAALYDEPVPPVVREFVWDGTSSGVDGWIDSDHITGLTNPAQLNIVAGHSIKSGATYVSENVYTYDDSGPVPYSITGRAVSRSQIIIGDLDGKVVGLSRYILTGGASITFGLWYGYFYADDNTFNSLQAMSTTKYFSVNYWRSKSAILPVDSSKTGGRFLVMAFKKGDGTTDFTTEELAEIPTLITINAPEFENTYEYIPSTGHVLSNESEMEVVGGDLGTMQESVSNNILNIQLPAGANNTHYVMIRKRNYTPANATKARIRSRIRINDISAANAECGFTMTIKAGDKCAGLYTRKSDSDPSGNMYFAIRDSSNTEIDITNAPFQLNQWYEVEAAIEDNIQTIKVNGTVIYTGTGNTYYGSSGCIFTRRQDSTGSLNMDMEWLEIEWT